MKILLISDCYFQQTDLSKIYKVFLKYIKRLTQMCHSDIIGMNVLAEN